LDKSKSYLDETNKNMNLWIEPVNECRVQYLAYLFSADRLGSTISVNARKELYAA